MRTYHKDGTAPNDTNVMFVFGSNLAGRHGAGAAKAALDHYNAEPLIGFGPFGWSFAIPTKDYEIETLPLDHVKVYVAAFIQYAKLHPDYIFFITRIGCGLAGYTDAEIAPMFRDAPANCSFAEEWKPYLEPQS